MRSLQVVWQWLVPRDKNRPTWETLACSKVLSLVTLISYIFRKSLEVLPFLKEWTELPN